MKPHHYSLYVKWTGNRGSGTSSYTAYDRSHTISVADKTDILASSDPAFRGDRSKHNPEELFLASLSSCHMLWYLHLCAEANIIVSEYIDHAKGTMTETSEGSGQFTEVTLCPTVKVREASMVERAKTLHQKANEQCFIANSCNFPILHEVTVITE